MYIFSNHNNPAIYHFEAYGKLEITKMPGREGFFLYLSSADNKHAEILREYKTLKDAKNDLKGLSETILKASKETVWIMGNEKENDKIYCGN